MEGDVIGGAGGFVGAGGGEGEAGDFIGVVAAEEDVVGVAPGVGVVGGRGTGKGDEEEVAVVFGVAGTERGDVEGEGFGGFGGGGGGGGVGEGAEVAVGELVVAEGLRQRLEVGLGAAFLGVAVEGLDAGDEKANEQGDEDDDEKELDGGEGAPEARL